MNRKRHIKKMMGHGIQRNIAADILMANHMDLPDTLTILRRESKPGGLARDYSIMFRQLLAEKKRREDWQSKIQKDFLTRRGAISWLKHIAIAMNIGGVANGS